MRNITKASPKRKSQNTNVQKFRSKLTKLIPGEIVTGYLFVKGSYEGLRKLAKGDENLDIQTVDAIMYVTIGILLVLTPILYRKAFKVTNRKQLFITSVAFGLWVFSIGGPFDYSVNLPLKNFVAGIMVVIFTMIFPLFFDRDEE